MYKVWNSNLIPPEYHINIVKDAPPSFNLSLLGFPKLETIKYGLKQSVVFYDRHDGKNYLDPLCRVIWQTAFDGAVPSLQKRSVSWKLVEGGWSQPHLSDEPIRNPKVFLQKMRSRVIEELIDLATNFGLGTEIKALYEQHATEIYIYIEGGSPKFRNAIDSESLKWLKRSSSDGRTVKDVIVQYLSIGVVENEAN